MQPKCCALLADYPMAGCLTTSTFRRLDNKPQTPCSPRQTTTARTRQAVRRSASGPSEVHVMSEFSKQAGLGVYGMVRRGLQRLSHSMRCSFLSRVACTRPFAGTAAGLIKVARRKAERTRFCRGTCPRLKMTILASMPSVFPLGGTTSRGRQWIGNNRSFRRGRGRLGVTARKAFRLRLRLSFCNA